MLLFPKWLLSALPLTMSITICLKAQSPTHTVLRGIEDQKFNMSLAKINVVKIESGSHLPSVNNVVPIVSTNVSKKITYNLSLDHNQNSWETGIKLTRHFNIQHNYTTEYSYSTAPTLQKDLFIKNISVKSFAFRRAVVAPALIIGAGLATLDKDNDDNYEIQQERNRYIPNFRHRIDDYLQHSPIIVVYGLNWLGVEGKNDFANRTALLIKSEAMVGILTFSMKRITAVPRPDTKEPTSFPSGHTAQAFAAATFMAKEYGHRSIWYSIGAYTVATGIGTMRVMNNRHWVSDVLVGAGIGILSTNLVYLTHQYRWGKKSKGSQTSIIPSYDGQTGMVNIIHQIN